MHPSKPKSFLFELVTVFLLLSACNNDFSQQQILSKYESGKPRETKTGIDSDTVDSEHLFFYKNGTIERRFYSNRGSIHGVETGYFENGNVNYQGNWSHGKKQGLFKYYDNDGHIAKVIEYLILGDTSISKPNQVIYFNQDGDTIVSKSNYFELYSSRDTIRLDKETFTFKLVLKGNIQKYTYLAICPMDSLFNVLPGDHCSTVEMKDGTITLSPEKYSVGENLIRGYIANTENPIGPDGMLEGKAAEYYFCIRYFVEP